MLYSISVKNLTNVPSGYVNLLEEKGKTIPDSIHKMIDEDVLRRVTWNNPYFRQDELSALLAASAVVYVLQ